MDGTQKHLTDTNGIDHGLPVSASIQTFCQRWLMLALFCFYSLSSAYQWIHLNIISNIMLRYYNASLPGGSLQQEAAIDWISLVYLLAYIPAIIPAMMLLNWKGLRVNNIVGSLLNSMGSWLKVAALGSERYAVLMFGQVLCALAEVFVVSIPPRLAAVWFGPNEVSTATSIGVFGNQIGIAIGFLIPPILVENSANVTDIGHDLGVMYYGTAGVTTLIFILMVVGFKEEPPAAPSLAQLLAKRTGAHRNYAQSLKSLATNRNYVLLAIAYGVLTGSFYALSILLNGMIIEYFPGEEENAGRIGLTIIVAGIAGAVLAGVWLDKTKSFKWTSLLIYVLSLVGMVVFTVVLVCDVGVLWPMFLVAGFLGFFMTGYLPVGYEFAAEITYPECEATSSGILTASAMFFGIVLTLGMRAVMNRVNILAANTILCVAVLFGAILTAFVQPDYRRQRAEKQKGLDTYDHAEMIVIPAKDPP